MKNEHGIGPPVLEDIFGGLELAHGIGSTPPDPLQRILTLLLAVARLVAASSHRTASHL
jgi:hypothetical protein